MLRKASEVRHNTDDDVAEIIDKALKIAESATCPDAMREAVFVQAVSLLSGKHIEYEQVGLRANGMAVPRG